MPQKVGESTCRAMQQLHLVYQCPISAAKPAAFHIAPSEPCVRGIILGVSFLVAKAPPKYHPACRCMGRNPYSAINSSIDPPRCLRGARTLLHNDGGPKMRCRIDSLLCLVFAFAFAASSLTLTAHGQASSTKKPGTETDAENAYNAAVKQGPTALLRFFGVVPQGRRSACSSHWRRLCRDVHPRCGPGRVVRRHRRAELRQAALRGKRDSGHGSFGKHLAG